MSFDENEAHSQYIMDRNLLQKDILNIENQHQGKQQQELFNTLLHTNNNSSAVDKLSKTKLFELNETLFDDKWKTELCVKFMSVGSCPYTGKCNFAHGKHELKSRIRHPNFKTRVCTRFLNGGKCPYGIRCTFLHDKNMKPLDATQLDKNPKLKRNYKTRPCAIYFKTQKCPYGDKCTFIHNIEEAKLNPQGYLRKKLGDRDKNREHPSGCKNVITVPSYENVREKRTEAYRDFKNYYAMKKLDTIIILKNCDRYLEQQRKKQFLRNIQISTTDTLGSSLYNLNMFENHDKKKSNKRKRKDSVSSDDISFD